jgi:hypothetical protein
MSSDTNAANSNVLTLKSLAFLFLFIFLNFKGTSHSNNIKEMHVTQKTTLIHDAESTVQWAAL